jgi:glycosyltransferase involved in cell wall biosynthesis
MTLYNNAACLPQAIESLLAQTHSEFRLVVVDDGSADDVRAIMQEYLARDGRISYFRNEERQGMVASWRRAFSEADREPMDYFAWASDHDVWHPRWLETLAQVLDENPQVVMAYPLTVRISDAGENLHAPSRKFETFGLDVGERIRVLQRAVRGFGNMIYGLFRAESLRRAGVFRRVLLPDTLLLWELTLQGSFKQAGEELWFRRYTGLVSIERQKRTLFVDPPWYLRLPYPMVNAASLAWNTALRPGAGRVSQRCMGGFLALMFLYRHVPYNPVRWLKRWLSRVGRRGMSRP